MSQYWTTLKDEGKSVKYGSTRKIAWIYGPPVQYYHGLVWRLVKDYRRRITEVAENKGKRCAPKHAEVCSVKYIT